MEVFRSGAARKQMLAKVAMAEKPCVILQSVMRFLIAGLLASSAVVHAAEPAPKVSAWNGFERLDFEVAGKAALLIKPKIPAAGHPWIWRTEFFGHEPQCDIALLGTGWHVAYFKVSDMYGAPASIDLMAQFHDDVVRIYGLNPRAVLEGFSRGGLYAVNFAATHPDKTAALYLDAPVLDIRSWPGGRGKGKGSAKNWAEALAAYGLTEETVSDFKGNPLDRLEPIAQARIPILSICGDADQIVPFAENTKLLEERYRALGGKIEVIAKAGVDHHPHSLKDPQPIVNFLLKNAYAR
jgi:pimeloyl-ACP methyl ester carboxylesterase